MGLDLLRGDHQDMQDCMFDHKKEKLPEKSILACMWHKVTRLEKRW